MNIVQTIVTILLNIFGPFRNKLELVASNSFVLVKPFIVRLGPAPVLEYCVTYRDKAYTASALHELDQPQLKANSCFLNEQQIIIVSVQ